jgi:hypothetical protein
VKENIFKHCCGVAGHAIFKMFGSIIKQSCLAVFATQIITRDQKKEEKEEL